MAENTKIEWCDHSWNPWIGCTKVGPGCDHCYAETLSRARLGVVWGPGQERRRTKPANWAKPHKWNREARAFAEANGGRKQRVFCASLADVFDNGVDPAWRRDLFDLIAATPNLDWLLVTKRIGNVAKMLAEIGIDHLPPHVWLGITVVNQAEADRDIPKLREAPATIRFLSIEPMLGAVVLRSEWLAELDWVICGGESGPGARPMHPDWARSLRDQCADAGVPFLFKQVGEWLHEDQLGWWPYGDDAIESCRWADGFYRVGKKAAGRLLDGVEHNGYPHA
ncbi:phage Gp37/Gp68 family protein [Novosphingobium piscinae]|uniref:Phage Gp37/Gp68 family protein n=1 Tax=Novosphingobium piscinae TaxID=1507448 RepID=A0A7X1FXD3_9SPHN|nr:phage Gp37/Gp68 family protein [Novosphingobium piscinae]